MTDYQLKLTDNTTVVWSGTSGEDAAQRYVASHPDKAVRAWRTYPRQGVFNGRPSQIIEAGKDKA